VELAYEIVKIVEEKENEIVDWTNDLIEVEDD
jgi:hypothetical protein